MAASLPPDTDCPEHFPLILASGSPRRRELLHQLGIPFTVVVSHVDETLDPGLPPEQQAIALALCKAEAVAAPMARGLVLGADTIVVIDGEILGKPENDEDAVRMLRQLSGRAHRVITGVALINVETGTTDARAVTSTVHVRALSEEDIEAYVATGEPRDKAGGYAIQGRGAALIDRWEGSFSNVVGLPLDEVQFLLGEAGYRFLDQRSFIARAFPRSASS